ncbi:Centromere/kinetochore protein zw10-like protein [Drosera capensis]
MDSSAAAVFESLDLGSLLPSTTTSTTPLSAPDLRLLIANLDAHSSHIKSLIRHHLTTQLPHFSSLLSLSSSSLSQSSLLSHSLASLLALVDGSEVYDEIREVVDEIRVRKRELEERREEREVMRVVVEMLGRLEEVRGMVRDELGRRVVEAAVRVRELKTALRVGEEEEEGESVVVFEFLRKEWGDCFDQIQELLVEHLERIVRFEVEHGRIRVCSGGSGVDGVELRAVLEAMDVLDILDYGLARTADSIIKHVIGPAMNLKAPASFIVEANENSGENCDAVLRILPYLGSEIYGLDGEALFSRMITLVNFIFKHICLENGQWMRLFGKLTWPRMSDLIISNFLNKVVPDDASKLSDFRRIVSMSSEFEKALKDIMFISASDKNDKRLSNFADNVETHFALRKKIEILAKARKLILQCDFTLPQDDRVSDCVVDLLFLSEKCVVSEAASQLMKLVHHTLQDVCLSSPRVALEFYHAARDALLFYEAIILVKLDRQLDNITLVAVLMHNDCLYLSQEILGLAFEYRSHLPSCIKDHAVFVDMAPRLRLLAEEILQRHILTVDLKLKEAIDAADGFQNTHLSKQYESAKLSLDQVVFILEKVHLIWEPVLMPSVYDSCMCMVLESVFSRISQDILLLDDIAAEETLELQRLIQLMLENLSSLLESLSSVRVDRFTGYPSEVHHESLGKWRTINLWIYGNGGDRFHQSHIYRFTITKRLLIENTKCCALGVVVAMGGG